VSDQFTTVRAKGARGISLRGRIPYQEALERALSMYRSEVVEVTRTLNQLEAGNVTITQHRGLMVWRSITVLEPPRACNCAGHNDDCPDGQGGIRA